MMWTCPPQLRLCSDQTSVSVTILSSAGHIVPPGLAGPSLVVLQPQLVSVKLRGELFNKIWRFRFDFVTDLGQQRKCPMKRRIAQNCHNRWHLDWRFWLEINEGIVILLRERKKMVSNSSIQVSGWLTLFIFDNIWMCLLSTIINTTKVLPITPILFFL